TRSAGTTRLGFIPTCMSSRASMTSRWLTMASVRESKIPPTGDLIRGVPAPGGTWPDHETAPAGAAEDGGVVAGQLTGPVWRAGSGSAVAGVVAEPVQGHGA